MNCIHCNSPNPEQWFYCRNCGKYTTNLYMMSALGKRTDIELTPTTVGEDIKHRNKVNYSKYRKKFLG